MIYTYSIYIMINFLKGCWNSFLMMINKYIATNRKIINIVLEYVDDPELSEEKYRKIINKFKKYEITNNHNEFRLFIKIISKIANNHNR